MRNLCRNTLPLCVKKRMLQCLLSTHPLFRVHFQQILQETQALRANFSKVFFLYLIQIVDLRKFHAKKPLILDEPFMKIRRQDSKRFLDQEKLIQLILPWEKWISIDQLTHDTSYSPHINLLAILASHEKLGRTIPPCGHIICNFLFLFEFKLPGEAKIAYFESVVLANKQIFRFDISVDDVLRMQVGQSFEELVHKLADQWHFEPTLCFLQHLQQIVLNILEGKIDDAFLSECLLQLHYIFMVGHFKNLHLPHRRLFCILFVIRLFEFFNSNKRIGFDIPALKHYSISPLSNRRKNLIFLHQMSVTNSIIIKLYGT